MATDGVHDEDERIIAYVSRKRARQGALAMALVAVAFLFAAGSPFILPPDPTEPPSNPLGTILFFSSLSCLFVVLALVSFTNSRRHRPTLIVSAKGIFVYRSSPLADKRWLPWREIAWVGYEIRAAAGSFQQSLIINVFQSPGASAKRPMLDTPSPTSPYPFTTNVLRISEVMLDMPVSELFYQIEQYIKVHAPLEWHGELSDEQRDHVLLPEPPGDPAVS